VARRAQKEWAKVSLAKRTAIMFRMRQLVLDHQDEMAKMIVAEHGKNYSDAVGEIQRGRETLDFATAINLALKGEHSFDISTGVDIHTLRQPVGVVAGICPFNFPAMVPMWMHPIAIATGNALILNPPSAHTPPPQPDRVEQKERTARAAGGGRSAPGGCAGGGRWWG